MYLNCILSTKNKIASSYTICSQNLVKVFHVRDLRVVLFDDLSFSEYRNLIHNKAIRNLGFLKRNSSEFNDPKCFIILDQVLIRLVFELSLVIWNPT